MGAKEIFQSGKLDIYIVGCIALLIGAMSGRSLPQWEDVANSPYSWAGSLLYFIFMILGVLFVRWMDKVHEKRNGN